MSCRISVKDAATDTSDLFLTALVEVGTQTESNHDINSAGTSGFDEEYDVDSDATVVYSLSPLGVDNTGGKVEVSENSRDLDINATTLDLSPRGNES